MVPAKACPPRGSLPSYRGAAPGCLAQAGPQPAVSRQAGAAATVVSAPGLPALPWRLVYTPTSPSARQLQMEWDCFGKMKD